jgi:large subunit ribosomal protein L10
MRPEKQLLLDDIKDQIEKSSVMVLTNYQKMDPNLASQFRMTLANSGGSYEVVRKRILLKAAEAAGVKLNESTLIGHIGVVFTDKDPVQVTKTIYQFAKENEDVLEVLAGRFEGKVVSANDVKQISELPSKDEMRAQFLSVLEAPLSQTLAVMDALLTSVPYCLENKSQNQNL